MKKNPPRQFYLIFEIQWEPFSNKTKFFVMLSKKTSMVTMVTDEFLENRIILQKSVAIIGFIWFFWFQKCILLYIFAQVFLVMRSIRSHISLFRLGFTPALIFEQNKLMQQTLGKHSMFWWCASTKQGKRAIQNARVCAIWIIYALESATRFDRVGVLSSQAAQRRETERFVRSLADDEGFCLGQRCQH